MKLEDGTRIIKIFKEYLSKTCILDDFKFYETRQKIIRDKKIKQKKQVYTCSNPASKTLQRLLEVTLILIVSYAGP